MATKTKRKLAEMNVDEFLAHGLDSDGSDGEESDHEDSEQKSDEASTTISKKSKTGAHKTDLESLKEKDPEFYKFLQENDKQLLEFDDTDTESELEDSEEEGEEEAGDKVEDEPSEGEESDEETKTKQSGKLVTMEMIKKWKVELAKHTPQSFKQVVYAFHAAVYDMLAAESTTEQRMRYRVEGNTIFNALIQLCLRSLYPVLQHHLELGSEKRSKSLPSNHKKWTQFKVTIKIYLSDVLQLLRMLAEPTMVCVILKHAQLLTPIFACFPKHAKSLIKRMVRMWGSGEEHIRVLAFITLNRLMKSLPSQIAEYALKQLYMSFVKNCKFTSPKTQPLIVFMENCLIEIFSHDLHNTYQHGFVYIRQLAIHLRNAMITKKKESHQSVYNWQFIHCLNLWSRILGEADRDGILQPLIYPLVQVTIGVIKLAPTARFYPLRFHCLESLNKLSEATGSFIPVAPFLLEVIESPEFNKKVKLSTQKPTDFRCILKIPKSQIQTKQFKDAVVERVYELLLNYFTIHAHNIAFPELVFPAVLQLKQFVKKCKLPKYVKQMKQLVDKLQETSKEVTARRSTVSFSPKDIQEVEQWSQVYKQQPNSLVKFTTTWKKMKEKADAMLEHQQVKEEDSDDEQPKPKKRKKAQKQTKEKEAKVEDVRESGKDVAEITEEAEDIVEDFSFSEDESE